jgi:pimeloyl-ACP methyl ester carboxylesterase
VEAEAAWDYAYADVADAFRYYLKHHGGGKLILFGHSQGALHVSRLLAEIIEPEGLVPRLVAAYVIGIGLSEGLFGAQTKFYRQLQPCQSPGQTGCVISWNSFLAGADLTLFQARTRARDEGRCGRVSLGEPICINPLSFDAQVPDVAAGLNPGTLVSTAGDLPLPPLQPGLAGAVCREGVLQVSLNPACPLQPLPGGNMHMHDIALFHASLRADVQRRASI